MRTKRQGVDGGRSARRRASVTTSARFGTLLKVQLGALALLATTFMLAVPAHAHSASASAPVPTSDWGARVGFEDDRVLGSAGTAGPRLPFARPDLTMLVLGGVIVILAAVGAPVLLQPLGGMPPVFATSTIAPDPLLPVSAQAAAHAPA